MLTLRTLLLRAAPAVVVLLYSAEYLGAGRQEPARHGSLSAIVVSDDASSTPLANAEVTLTGVGPALGPGFTRSVATGDDGQCLFDDVPAGLYVMRAGKPGYVTTSFGARAGDDDPTPIAVATSERTSGIALRLPTGAAIAGTVWGKGREPAAHASVVLMELAGTDRRFARMSDAANAGAVVRTQSDDDGGYRLYGLPPGVYLVQASVLEQPASGSSSTATLARGYYPASADVAGASLVTVSGGEEIRGIDVQVQPLTLVDVSGVVAWPTAEGRPRLRLLMFPDGLFARPEDEQHGRIIVASPDGMFVNPVPVRADDSFVVRGVPRGEYEIWTRSVPANVVAEDDPGPAVWGRTRISVGTQDLSNVVVTLQPATVVIGRVELDTSTSPADRRQLTGASVVLVPVEPPSVRSRALRVPAAIQADGTFRLIGVTPGRYMFDIASSDRTWSVMSAQSGGRDLFESPIEIGSDESIANAVLKVTTVRQAVSGTLIDGANRPAGGMRVVVFPDDPRLWLSGSRRIRTVKTATDGTFAVADLPAGDYRLGALDMSLDNPGVLDALARASVPFTLGRGENKIVNIRRAG